VVGGLVFFVWVLGAFFSASGIAWIHPFRMFEAHCSLLVESRIHSYLASGRNWRLRSSRATCLRSSGTPRQQRTLRRLTFCCADGVKIQLSNLPRSTSSTSSPKKSCKERGSVSFVEHTTARPQTSGQLGSFGTRGEVVRHGRWRHCKMIRGRTTYSPS
jgi:hypothetical protein